MGCCPNIAATADASHDPFFFPQPAGPIKGLIVGNLQHFIDEAQIEILGNEVGADALNFVRPRLERLFLKGLSNDR